MIRSSGMSDCPALQQVQIDRSIAPDKHSKGANRFLPTTGCHPENQPLLMIITIHSIERQVPMADR